MIKYRCWWEDKKDEEKAVKAKSNIQTNKESCRMRQKVPDKAGTDSHERTRRRRFTVSPFHRLPNLLKLLQTNEIITLSLTYKSQLRKQVSVNNIKQFKRNFSKICLLGRSL